MNETPTDGFDPRIILQGIHVELTGALQARLREKFAVLLRHEERILRVNLRLHRDQTHGRLRHYTATGQVELPGPNVVASAEDDDAYAALDRLVDKLDELLRERHERRRDRQRAAPGHAAVSASSVAGPELE